MEQVIINSGHRRSVVAVGNFDGVHKGHQTVFSKTSEIAATENMRSVALTFTPHPKNFFDASHPVKIITDDNYKKELITSFGIESVIFQRFDSAFASMNCAEFVSFLKNELSCDIIVCGEGFKFGKNAGYGTEDLENECVKHRMRISVVNVNHLYSSSKIRELIKEGNVQNATELMGRPFSYSSIVVSGKKIGNRIGFPTINQKLPLNSVVPKFGVYSGYVYIEGICRKCIVNIGCRPTVNEDKSDIDSETHIFGYSGNLYGKELRVFITSFVREERKFSNLSELSAQIKNDCRFVIENGI